MEFMISIVEDMEEQGKQLECCLLEWADKKELSVRIMRYESAEEFLTTEYRENFLIFLDIQLKTMNGMEVAEKLRETGYQGNIIFLTAFREYVFEGYHVRALDYLIKPVTYEILEQALNPVLESMSKHYFVIENKKELQKITYTDIYTMISSGHYVDIKTERENYHYRQSINALEDMLPDYFIRIHRTAIVNIHYVAKIVGNDLYLTNGEILPVSSKYMEKLRKAFLFQMP